MNLQKIKTSYGFIVSVVFVAILAVLPFFLKTSPYWLHIGILCMMYSCYATCWNMVAGFTGIFSLGFQALSGIGGYVSSDNAVESYKQVIGNAQPWFTFGWNNTVRWKNLDVSVFFRGVVGNKILNVARWIYGPQTQTSVNFFAKDCIGDNVTYANKANFSDYYLENGSYLKLDNLTVGYTFRFKENKYIDNLRLYLTGQNLFTITSYSGQDPEIDTTSVWSSGIDYPSFYPRVATILLGLNLSLF